MFNWYVIYTKSRAEAKVAERFRELGLEIYFPEVTEIKQWSDRKKKIIKPLFTSYVFVKIEQDQYEDVRRVSGVVNFLYHLGKPAVIRQKEIDNIINFLSKVSVSTIVFELLEEVIIKTGPLKDQKGIIQSVGKDSLRIILSELNVSMIAKISKADAEKA